MTQPQFEIIVKIVSVGAPALAAELNDALNELIIDRNKLAAECEELRALVKAQEENLSSDEQQG